MKPFTFNHYSGGFIKLAMLVALLALPACSIFNTEDEKPPLPGERKPVLSIVPTIDTAPDAATFSVSLPGVVSNNSWPQVAYGPENAKPNAAIGEPASIQRIWKKSEGKGSTRRVPLAAAPVLQNGSVYVLDGEATVHAYHDQTGRKLWARKIRPQSEDEYVLAGGIAADTQKLYVAGGYNEIVALDLQSGDVVWRKMLKAGVRAAPSVRDNRVFVKSLNNTLLALDASSGSLLWSYENVGGSTGLLGASAPAVDENIVVVAFSSGDVAAIRVDNGALVWSDRLVNPLQPNSLSTLADIRGMPVIYENIVYVISYGGRMTATNIRNGVRIWEKDIASAETPLVSGNAVFVITNDQLLVAMDRMSGNVIWTKAMPRYANPEKREKPLNWAGPQLVGNMVMLTGSNGLLHFYSPQSGELAYRINAGTSPVQSAVPANNGLYVFGNDGALTSFR